MSTVVLLVTYVGVAIAVVAYAGTDFLAENADEEEAIFALLADEVHGRLGLGGAARRRHLRHRLHADDDHPGLPHRACRWPAGTRCPRRFAHIIPRFRTPDVSTWWVGGHRHRLVPRGRA